MPTIQKKVTIPAGAVNDNVLEGSQFEFLPFNAFLEFGLVGSASADEMFVDVYSGQDVLAEDMTVTDLDRIPVYPDDFPLTDVAMAGERIKIRVRNTGASPNDFYFNLRITPA